MTSIDAKEENALLHLLRTAFKISKDRPINQEDAQWHDLKDALSNFEAARNGN